MKDWLRKQLAECSLISLLKWLTIPPMEALKHANLWITADFAGSQLQEAA